jgi:hypothetical protein
MVPLPGRIRRAYCFGLLRAPASTRNPDPNRISMAGSGTGFTGALVILPHKLVQLQAFSEV